MIDWSASMQQTFEFYEVDPVSWRDRKPLNNIKSCTINRDPEAETLGSATFDVTESVGECYVRVYLIATQGDITEKIPLGTYLVQTPTSTFDGRVRNVSMDAYTPLLELKEKYPPIGYFVKKDTKVMKTACSLLAENCRAPVGGLILNKEKPTELTFPSDTKLTYNFVAETDDSWLSFISDLITAAYTSTYYKVDHRNGIYFVTNERIDIVDGNILENIKTTRGDQVYSGTERKITRVRYCVNSSNVYYKVEEQNGEWVKTSVVVSTPTYGALVGAKTSTGEDIYLGYVSETNSILYCAVDNDTRYRLSLDELGGIFFIPEQDINAMQPVWIYNDDNSSILYPELTMDHDLYDIPNIVEILYSDGNIMYHATARNDDPNSPISTVNRGREIVHRITNPNLFGTPTQKRVEELAKKELEERSSIEYTITYTHGYCPVKVHDCVRFNYIAAGITNVKAKVIHQSIKCEPGCPVTEKAVFTVKLWEGGVK